MRHAGMHSVQFPHFMSISATFFRQITPLKDSLAKNFHAEKKEPVQAFS